MQTSGNVRTVLAGEVELEVRRPCLFIGRTASALLTIARSRLTSRRATATLWSWLACVGAVLLVSYWFPDWVFHEEPRDGFAYLGFMVDPVGQMRRFPTHPMSGLGPAFWPAHPFLVLFAPKVGYWIYKILIVSLLLLLVNRTAIHLYGAGSGLLSVILVGSNAFFFPAEGNPYVEGMVIFYFALVLYLLVRAATNRRRIWAWLMGVAGGCLVSSALLAIAYVPGLTLLYLLLKRKYGRPPLERGDAWIGVGLATSFAVFSFVHRLCVGTWFYLASAILKGRLFLANDRTPGALTQWMTHANWLFPCAILLFYLFVHLGALDSAERGPSRRWLLQRSSHVPVIAATLSCVGAMVFLQLTMAQETLSNPHYYNHLIPLISLALVGVFRREFGSEFGRRCGVLSVAAVAAVCCVVTGTIQSPPTLLALAIGTLVWALLSRGSPWLVRVAAMVSCWASVAALHASLTASWALSGPCRPVATTVEVDGGRRVTIGSLREQEFMTIVYWMKLVRLLDKVGNTWIWYDIAEPLGTKFDAMAAASHLWQARLINEYFPQVDVTDHDWHGPSHRQIAAGMDVLVPTAFGDQKLEELTHNLERKGLRFELLARRTFARQNSKFEAFHLRILRQ